jgi:hypothetical protein
MSSNTPNPCDKEVKISMRWDTVQWSAWSKLAQDAGYDPIDYIRMMVIERVTKAKPPVLPPEELTHLDRLNRLIRKVVGIATKMYHNGEFTPDITLHVFQRAMQDKAFVADYTAHIGGADPYVHGNPLKEVNRELGWRIKNAMPVEVEKDKDGKVVERRNLKGEVIQSYTLLKLRDEIGRQGRSG